jgi:carboxyl-terminal processing protease
MNSKFAAFQRLLVILLFSVIAFYGGYYIGQRGFIFEVKKNPPEIKVVNQSPADVEVDFSLFWEVWNLVGKEYLLRPVDAQNMLYGAISGMVNSLGDPYTSFLIPVVNESVSSALKGVYEGIGAELGLRDGQLIVVAPLDGSPAKASGIRAGDAITEIEGESTLGITLTQAVAKIRGEAGTISTLTIKRAQEEDFIVRIKRGAIVVSSVTWEDKGNGTAYIRVGRFGTETNKEWNNVASEVNIEMNELDAVIIDVRGNPGGFLQSSVHIAGEFFRDKPVLYEELATGEQIPLVADRNGIFSRLPVFVLIDEGSASASEILAAALKVHVDAILIGQKSFGKGTIQDARDFNDGSGLHITVAKWLTPEKVWVHEVGILPDVEVERTSDDVNNGDDPQLDKAIELAKEI